MRHSKLQCALRRFQAAKRLYSRARRGQLSLSEACSELNTARAQFHKAVREAEAQVVRWSPRFRQAVRTVGYENARRSAPIWHFVDTIGEQIAAIWDGQGQDHGHC